MKDEQKLEKRRSALEFSGGRRRQRGVATEVEERVCSSISAFPFWFASDFLSYVYGF